MIGVTEGWRTVFTGCQPNLEFCFLGFCLVKLLKIKFIKISNALLIMLSIISVFLLYSELIEVFNMGDFSVYNPYLLSVFPFTPAKEYDNLLANRKDILSDNQDKSGIYCWFNILNGNFYIGSSVNLKARFVHYYSPS